MSEKSASKGPASAIREQVGRELKESRETYGSMWREGFYNNFKSWLPQSDGHKGFSARNLYKDDNKSTDTKFGELLKGDANAMEKSSELRLGQTPRQFLAIIDEEIAQANLSVEKIKELQEREVKDEFYDYIEPLYVRLREMGYTYEDLTL